MRILKEPLYVLFLLLIVSCNQSSAVNKNELQLEIIQSTIYELIPHDPGLLPLEILYDPADSKEDQKRKFDSVARQKRHEIDSMGMEILLSDKLEAPRYLLDEVPKKYIKANNLIMSDLTEQRINIDKLVSNKRIKICRRDHNRELPVNAIGTVFYSGMYFNAAHDRAMFEFQYLGRSCIDGYSQLIVVRKKNNKWIITSGMPNVRAILKHKSTKT